MTSQILIDYKPVNYTKNIVTLFCSISLTVVIASLFFFMFSGDETRLSILNHWYYVLFVVIIIFLISLMQLFFRENIYIYFVGFQNELVIIKWKKLYKYKEAVIPINQLQVKLVPYGKDNPYLQISWNNGNIIKQFFNKGWDKNDMNEFIYKINQISVQF